MSDGVTVPRFEVATVGDNCIDRYLPMNLQTVGGNAVNVAVQLVRCGRPAAYFGAVGDDAPGAWTRHTLAENQVDLEGLRVVRGSTATTDIDVNPDGDRIIGFEDFGVCRGYRPNALEIDLLRSLRHVHLGWLDDGGALKYSLAHAGVSTSQDLAVNPGAEGLAIAFASAGESMERAKVVMEQALAGGARLAVVTCGGLGSIASDGGCFAETGIAPVEVLDTTGAGDTFIAAFIDAHLKGLELAACLAAGRDTAAKTCVHFGGFPQRARPLVNI
jgi:fructoselysine 6-kinase